LFFVNASLLGVFTLKISFSDDFERISSNFIVSSTGTGSLVPPLISGLFENTSISEPERRCVLSF